MPTRIRARKRPGMNLIEVMVAAATAGVIFLALGGFIVGTFKANAKESDVAFAMQKATQLMEELTSLNSKDPADPGADRYADGAHFELTITAGVAPTSPLSGNPLVKGNRYKFVRAIYSTPIVGDPFARQVTVKVWLNDGSATATVPGTEPLAQLTSVLRSNIAAVAPKQVLDVYMISIENLPHLVMQSPSSQYYPSPSDARSMFAAALGRLQAKYPGLEFRKHIITRLSEGRDNFYRPYINTAKGVDEESTSQDPLNWVYFMPGKIDDSAAKYFDETAIAGGILKGEAGADTKIDGPYTLADQFNHAVRHGEEIDDAGQPIIPAGLPASGDVSNLSLRQFLEELLTDTSGKYRNAIVVNLHGNLFPALPLRNYSDAAMDPADTDTGKRKRRLVTHPMKLVNTVDAALGSTEPVHLLVHPYMADGSDTPRPASGADADVLTDWGPGDRASNARIIVRGIRTYIGDSPFTISGTPDLNVDQTGTTDIRVQALQRTRLSNPNAYVQVERTNQWPPNLGTLLATDLEGTLYHDKGSRKGHSGPHASAHTEAVCHGTFSGGAAISPAHGKDPEFIGDDLYIYLSDLDYDAHRTTDSSGNEWGLDSSTNDRKLYGLQYFPDPFLPLLNLASDAGGTSDRPRNTARAVISFRLLPTASGKRFEVETQLRKYAVTSDGAATTFGSGIWPAADSDPAVSRTWFYARPATSWSGGVGGKEFYTDVPLTDQFQLVGDPRHVPYVDGRLNKLYNPYWTEFTTSNQVYKDVDNSDLSSASKVAGPKNVLITDAVPGGSAGANTAYPGSTDEWLGMKYNAPAYFRIWREALLRNGIVFVNNSGGPMEVLGMGGEFKVDAAVNGISDVEIRMKPYDGSTNTDAGSLADELYNTSEGNKWIERGDGQWAAVPWIGEIFPPDQWTNWSTKGNLPTGSSSSSNYRRVSLDQVDRWDVVADKTKTNNHRDVGTDAFGLFLNAIKSGSTSPFDLDYGSTSDTSNQTNVGKTVSKNLGMALASSLKGPYSYKLTGGSPAPGWTAAPDNANRLLMDWVNPTPSYGPAYYNGKNSGEYAVSPFYIQGSATDLRKAVIVPVAHRPESVGRYPNVMDIAATAAVAAYFDSSQAALDRYNVKPLPRVKITEPLKNTTLTGNLATIKAYAKYMRSTGDPLSPLYPSELHSPPVNPTAGDPYDVKFFMKYAPAGTTNYKTALFTANSTTVATTVPFSPGVPTADPAVPPVPHNPYFPASVDFAWDISGLANGDYVVRVEAFRFDSPNVMEGHYSYHEIPVSIEH